MDQHNYETEQPSRKYTKEIHIHFDVSRKVWGIGYRV